MSDEQKDPEELRERSSYEKEIERLIGTFGEKLLSQSILSIALKLDLELKKVKVTTFFDKPTLILENLNEGIESTTAAQLMSLLRKQLSHRKNQYDRYKLEVIFKHLSGAYARKRHFSIIKINKKIDQIRNGDHFPDPDLSTKPTGEDDSKFKSLSKLLQGKQPHINSYTIRFAIALLGIKLIPLEKRLFELRNEAKEEPTNGSNQSESTLAPLYSNSRPPLNKKNLLIKTLTVLLIVSVAYFAFRHQTASKSTLFDDIPSHEVFNMEMEIGEEVAAKDCVTIVPYLLTFKDVLVNEDTIPLNRLWIKFRVTNFSDQTHFPDAIYLKKIQSNSLQGQIVERARTILDSTSLIFNIAEGEKKISQGIQTTSSFPSIAAKSHAIGEAMLIFSGNHPPRIHNFKLGLSMSGGVVEKTESLGSFKVAVSK